MTSQSLGSLLGAVVAVIVLGAAVVYGPIGQMGKPPKPAAVQQPAAVAPAPEPAPRGPVIREVPN
jgi:hypothetical protein